MAGSIEANSEVYKNTYKYVPPVQPSELIESSTYTINFSNRKFITVGIDPTNNFKIAVQIITSSRYVKLSSEYLQKVFSLMGQIFSTILDPVYHRLIFLDTDSYKLSTMKYRGENMLVIESKTDDGCRILLDRSDLLALQDLEATVFETVEYKNKTVHPLIMQEFNRMVVYFIKNSFKTPMSLEDMSIKIRLIEIHTIKLRTPKDIQYTFINQLKMLASEQLALGVLNKLENEIDDKLQSGSLYQSPPSFFSPEQPTNFTRSWSANGYIGSRLFEQDEILDDSIDFYDTSCKAKRKLF